MFNVSNLLDVFSYLETNYGQSHEIYINVNQVVPTFVYIWDVEGSNLTFKFKTIQEFVNAYERITNSNTEINHIIYKSNFVTFKFYPNYKRVFLSTENYNDISYLHSILNREGVKEILYSFKNYNN